ncbi:MAG: ribosome-associated translation inhibitor RaiA [Erythrobacter sp.]
MDIRVSGHQVETGSALQDHASDRLGAITDKYFEKAISSHVTFGKAPASGFRCDIVTHAMQGLVLKAQAEAQDAHQAFDAAAAKIDKQLRRYKSRIKDRHEQTAYAAKQEEAAYTIFAADDPEEEVVADSPPVIAETSVYVPETNLADAVMLLDLQDTPALFFKNAGTGRHNMVYRRADGSIGWVEPQ